eukprot:scaffold3652_cov15-Tisochrysis_lutea.AAC.1
MPNILIIAPSLSAPVPGCQSPHVGGLLLVAPEHRASLQLKRDETWQWGDRAVCAQLDKLKALPYTDIVDENDVLLSHKYQLVYACGSQAALPSREERVAAIQACLCAVSKLTDMPESILHTPSVAIWTARESRYMAVTVNHPYRKLG